jgi:catechol 2,3-dioxygenase-like lactoylglutathione lyase family enzyme
VEWNWNELGGFPVSQFNERLRRTSAGGWGASATFIAGVIVCVMAGCASPQTAKSPTTTSAQRTGDAPMQLGNFSVSLAVKDLAASRAFYEKLGFRMVAGDPAKNWIVLSNDTARIGLFQGMFDKNTLTFNPGWDHNKQTLPSFEDVRDIQKTLKTQGLTPAVAADEATSGPAFFILHDPDGNPILIDQHVPRPASH